LGSRSREAQRVIAVFVGGAAGSALRALTLAWLAPWGGEAGVVVVNLLGAFLLGIVFVLADDAELLTPIVRLFVAVGLLGGFTTFSTLVWGLDVNLGAAQMGVAATDLLVSVAGGLLAVRLGMLAGDAVVMQLDRFAVGVLVRLEPRRRRQGQAARDIASIEAEDREQSA
jgi:CrcB protein